jgi:hypothetical protein
MNDTPLHIEKQMAQMMATKTPVDRLRMASSMYDSGKKIMLAGMQNANVTLTQAQTRTLFFKKMYGDCFSKSKIDKIIRAMPNMQID